ncbi:Uncharacterised protein [Klebsiella pneumoniae]|nr:Uncharacterised protein [Klebsiella pneumoniae]
MFAVANNRVPQMGKMATKLVLASSFRLQFHQAVARGRVTSSRYRHFYGRQTAIMRHCWLRAFIFAGKFISDFVQFFHQWIIQHRFFHQPATHNRMVTFLDLVLFKLLCQQPSGFAG